MHEYSICSLCWWLLNQGPPTLLKNIHKEVCSWCLQEHTSGIYIPHEEEEDNAK